MKRGQRAEALLYPGAVPRKGDTCLRIAETFTSRQGEGRLTGVPSFFIRTSGCNLRCWFCDTPYASWKPEGSQVAIADLLASALRQTWPDTQSGNTPGSLHLNPAQPNPTQPNPAQPVGHVVLTGGEPLIAAGIVELAAALRENGLHVTIETAGTVDVEIDCDLLSLSPKLRGSTPDAEQHPRWAKTHAERRLPVQTMRNLIDRSTAVQVKFVVDSEAEYGEILDIVGSLHVPAGDVWIMPQGVAVEQLDAAATWLRPWTESHGFQYCDRMQIRWYGNRRGT